VDDARAAGDGQAAAPPERLHGSNFVVDHFVPGENVQCVLSRAQHEVRGPKHESHMQLYTLKPAVQSMVLRMSHTALENLDLTPALGIRESDMSRVQASQMVAAVSAAVERGVADGSIREDQGKQLMQSYRADLSGYTYLSS
jgi:Arginine decarboxylase C-terminal helical extension